MMEWITLITKIFVAVCFILGSALAFTASIGLIRFPDTLSRMHAASKPQVLGVILIILGTSCYEGTDLSESGMLILTIIFILITTPAASHRIGKIAYYEQFLEDKIINPESSED